jgi:hypothetical protein
MPRPLHRGDLRSSATIKGLRAAGLFIAHLASPVSPGDGGHGGGALRPEASAAVSSLLHPAPAIAFRRSGRRVQRYYYYNNAGLQAADDAAKVCWRCYG